MCHHPNWKSRILSSFSSFAEDFSFCQCRVGGLRMRREEPLGEDAEPSILIHSLFARHQPHVLWMPPQDGSSNISHIIQLQNHHITMICHNAKSTRIEIEIDGTFLRLVSIVQKSSLMHLSNHEMKKVSRLCNWLESQRSWVAINPKVFAKLHLWWKQVTASWHTNLYHAVPQWYAKEHCANLYHVTGNPAMPYCTTTCQSRSFYGKPFRSTHKMC